MMDHGEKECGLHQRETITDGDPPYELWFQNDVLGSKYPKSRGRRFGLIFSEGWSMQVLMDVEEAEEENA